MEITYSKTDLKNIIKSYYLEKEGRNVNVSIKTSKELTGFYGTLRGVTTITVKETISLLGQSATVKESISKEALVSMFNELLESEGYTLENLELDDGIREETVGYFMNEHTEHTAYFNGVKITASKVNTLRR